MKKEEKNKIMSKHYFCREVDGITYHTFNFKSLTDLYNYIKVSKELINKDIFKNLQSEKDTTKYGEPLATAQEYLLKGYTKDINSFVEVYKKIAKTIKYEKGSVYTTSKYHGRIIPSRCAIGTDYVFRQKMPGKEIKHFNIYYNFSYPHGESKEAIRNRGLATLLLIKFLESKGYIVNLTGSSMNKSCDKNEVLIINVNLKDSNRFNEMSCYFPFVSIEFLRRIIFRVLETVPTKTESWGQDYGWMLSNEEMEDIVKERFSSGNSSYEKNIFINYPKAMDIDGYDIINDFTNLIRKVGLEDQFNQEELKRIKL